MSDRVVFSMKEVAHLLGVSLSFVYDELSRGRLRAMKLGARRLVHVDDFNAYIAAHRPEDQAA